MGQIIRTISLSKEEDEYITESKLSPTKLLRNRIQEMIELDRDRANPTILKELNRKIERMSEIIQEYVDYLDKKGLIDDFLEQKDKQ